MMILRPVSRGPWRALGFLGLILVLDPVGAWYKHVASPRYHTVGRASGLLMGVGRSPYLWRRALEEERRQSLDAAPSLPANRESLQWPVLQLDPAEAEPWTTMDHSHLGSQGAPGKGRASGRAIPHQASPRTQAVRNLLAAFQHQGAAWTPQCPSGCRRPPMYPELLVRVMRKKGQLDATQEARIFKPEIGSLME